MTNNQRPARGISPASKAQVSGYKFLQRRAELGLLLGDVRMLHDPIAKLRRGLLFGLSAAVLLGVGSGALAVFSPAADPGDAPIMRSDSGDLFVRVDQQIHPVANLASARLVAGEPAQPVKASDSVLAREHIGVPIGIPDAPRIVPEKSQEQPAWHVCHWDDTVEVTEVHDPHQRDFPAVADNTALVAATPFVEYLIVDSTRYLLPPADSPAGRSIRRRIGMTESTVRWRPPAEVISLIPEGPPIALPAPESEILHSGKSSWLNINSHVVELTELHLAILNDLGWRASHVPPTAINDLPDAQEPLRLPERKYTFEEAALPPLCIGFIWQDDHDTQPRWEVKVFQRDKDAENLAVELSGDSPATHYAGTGMSQAVDTGSGWHVVSEHGQRHTLMTQENAHILGFKEFYRVPWEVVGLLPEGSALTAEAALAPLY
ncbi:type VII secretion protein EccB [Corynebacterium diphtheriae]|nr:type VII secretion protein EccB [Corynebacterium diphtheriae]